MLYKLHERGLPNYTVLTLVMMRENAHERRWREVSDESTVTWC